MKQYFLITFLAMCSLCTMAQDETQKWWKQSPHEIKIGIGYYPLEYNSRDTYNCNDCYINSYGDYNTNESYVRSEDHLAALALSYTYRISKWFSGELRATYSQVAYNYFHIYTDDYLSTERKHNFGIIPSLRVNWVRTPVATVYSAAGFGVLMAGRKNVNGQQNTRTFSTYIVPHINFLGVSVGRKLYGFAEFSASTSGTISGGIGYRF